MIKKESIKFPMEDEETFKKMFQKVEGSPYPLITYLMTDEMVKRYEGAEIFMKALKKADCMIVEKKNHIDRNAIIERCRELEIEGIKEVIIGDLPFTKTEKIDAVLKELCVKAKIRELMRLGKISKKELED